MLYKLDLPLLSRMQPCRSLANVRSGHKFADVNCDGVIDELDSLAIAAAYAGVPLPQEDGCTPVGEPL